MSEKYRPIKGDRVRVVLEGEVRRDAYHTFTIFPDNDSVQISFTPERVKGFNVSIEKIEPPVVVFQPGDVVRSKRYGLVYSLGHKGYLSATSGRFVEWGNGEVERDYFTSANYEKVNLSS